MAPQDANNASLDDRREDVDAVSARIDASGSYPGAKMSVPKDKAA
jgi:hypothetical protein